MTPDEAADPVFFVSGGTVYDGTGAGGRRADLLVRDGLIAEIDGEPPPGARVIDARGLAVAPGFIDLHSHADLILTLLPEERRRLQRCKLLQGITTEIVGNCGLGAAPLTAASRGPIRSVLSWMSPEGSPWDWCGFEEYLERLAAEPLPLNVGVLAAHGPIRAAVLGMEARIADDAERERMRRFVDQALEAGALGLSAGLIYPPGMHADTTELVALAEPLARAGRVLTCHLRGSSETLLSAVRELVEIGARAGCAVHHSHSEAVGPAHWGKIAKVLSIEEEARSQGIRVTADLFPYHAAATMMLAIYPPSALEGGPEALLRRLSDPGDRARIRRAVETQAPSWPPWLPGGWPHNLVGACGYERIFVSRTGGRTGGRWDGLSLRELGEARGTDPFEAISDLMVEEQGEVAQWIFGITGEDGNDGSMTRILGSPYTAIATDACDYGKGLPHPAAYGTFPRILARFVRERSLLTLPEAIRRMTALPADVIGLTDRGRISPGLAADLVVFDPARVEDRASFENPRALASGIVHLLLNGRLAVRDGLPQELDRGRLLGRR